MHMLQNKFVWRTHSMGCCCHGNKLLNLCRKLNKEVSGRCVSRFTPDDDDV